MPWLPLGCRLPWQPVTRLSSPLDDTNSSAGQSNHTAERREFVGVELSSNRLKAAALIPPWLLCEEPMPWLCDARTLVGSGAQQILEVRGCVALWCGWDPDRFNDAPAFSEAIAKWRACPDRWAAVGVPAFLHALDLAIAALCTGALASFEPVQDPPEATLVTAETFKRWAEASKLVRPRNPQQAGFLDGDNLWPRMALVKLIYDKHFRPKESGGPLDIDDPSTYPLPKDVRATMRASGRHSMIDMERAYAVARDPRLPVGKPRARK